ncbi:uncharacterized protein THITE_107962 [Thermothielavioides terrestris NRRL 8126]|uniref:Uncharacterized protein n=1 Tax=Thermothielavioides terrestris (strain ATCC 38088 / NRRL 8126) TaxID=578455 RepID=G2QQZ1_THETT|nr:uncharacterized protein THITE_107962 [Thermothielavioides terrestris NRRL 8126]AEO62443.1 hypothetical protein THITE_107962 [Thermothielavioides terrestris NRRL 8126]
MAPTYTMSAHLCKQIYSSWRQTRQSSPEPHPLPSPPASTASTASYLPRSPSPEKQSLDSERGEASHPPLTRQSSLGSSWRWGSR